MHLILDSDWLLDGDDSRVTMKFWNKKASELSQRYGKSSNKMDVQEDLVASLREEFPGGRCLKWEDASQQWIQITPKELYQRAGEALGGKAPSTETTTTRRTTRALDTELFSEAFQEIYGDDTTSLRELLRDCDGEK